MQSYGNVPEEDVAAVAHASIVASRVSDRLPATVPFAWRDIAFELALDGILRDWVMNGTNDLDEEDEEDLVNLLALAADQAMLQPPARQEVAFRTIGKNVMQDWVANWNDDD
jgi:hypothetical protein